MRSLLLTSTALLCTLAAVAQSAVGTWESVDDKTGEVRSLIEIYARGGELYGKIARTMDPDAPPTCTSCSGAFKDKPFVGMEIITGVEPDGAKAWDDGEIYDPESDKTYGLSLWIEDDPNVLYVRGRHWTGLYRTQTWQRAGE